MNYSKYKEFFEQYSNTFTEDNLTESEEVHIKRKKGHSYRVAENALKICESLNLNERDTLIEYVIALFHDIGRFYQFKNYHTFDEQKSENHAKLSTIVINQNIEILDDFTEEEKDIILKAIFLHNQQDLPDDLNEREFMFCAIVRDADKLDGFKTITELVPKLSKEEQNVYYTEREDKVYVSKEVYEHILNHQSINDSILQTVLDKQLRTLAFIYNEIIYAESIRIIYENDYVDKIYNLLPKTSEVDNVYNLTKEYIKNRINENNK